jgi:hypothetical protein
MSKSQESEVNQPGSGHGPPYTWIPAPRFREDKLRGNDPPVADRESEGVLAGLMNQAPTQFHFVRSTHGACRGAEPLCVHNRAPKSGGQGVDS